MNKIEKSAFLKLFNRRGYVLDFSTNDFDIFTTESVRIPLCQKYESSKGASLTAFCSEASDFEVSKLLFDLLQYYEYHIAGTKTENEDDRCLFDKCKQIMERDKLNIQISSPAITCVTRDYIRDIAARAMSDVDEDHYDSAITKSRTLLEEVFIYAIEKKGEAPSENGDIGKLYGQVKTLYNMHQSKDVDKRINGLLSGLEKILSAIAEMRNKGSDSHGVGAKRINIADHHARLFVNSAMTMANFVLSVCERQTQNEME